jgi:hypothetical protein
MNNDDTVWTQRRLGYLVFSGKEMKIITPRLRDVSFGKWLSADRDEEFEAQAEVDRKLALRYARQSNERHWLLAIIQPLLQDHPDITWGEAFDKMSASDAAKARAILLPPEVPVEDIPLERTHRLEWHERVEGILAQWYRARQSLEDDVFDDLLLAAGIGKDSDLYPDALIHVRGIAEAIRSAPAGVSVPLVVPQLTDLTQ